MSKIINILKKKSLPVDEFINIALYDKKFGYYMKKNPFGEKGDFVTAPLISNLFSEMIAIWCVSFWEYLGKPKKFYLIELGPGDGTLCKDLLRSFRNFKDFYNSIEIKLVEKSTKLKKIQKTKIKDKKVQWIERIEDLKVGPLIFLCNEFFDSLPIKQIYKKNNLFLERYITLSKKENKLIFSNKKINKNLIKILKNLNLVSGNRIIEYPIEAIKYLKIISSKINKYNGGFLCLDYGYKKNKEKYKDTLQSIKKHAYYNILSDPGNSDITSHINYKLFSKILKNNNLRVEKIKNQSDFLYKLGIIERANILSKNVSFKEKANIFYRLKRLLSKEEMGDLFKVLFAQNKKMKFSLGFK
jgi:NADH dehydrogenase [ubiquinone] 1 alpha subcomplex assembly factor 7